MILYFDRMMGIRLPQALQMLGLEVHWHNEQGYDPTTPDEEWLSAVGPNGWIVLTHDTKIEKRQHEIRALIDAGVGCFVMRDGSSSRWMKARQLANAWDRITKIVANEQKPYVYKINKDRSLRRIAPRN